MANNPLLYTDPLGDTIINGQYIDDKEFMDPVFVTTKKKFFGFGYSFGGWENHDPAFGQLGTFPSTTPNADKLITMVLEGMSYVQQQQKSGGYYDWSNAKTTLDHLGGVLGGLETTVRPGNQWLGQNGKYYDMSWGGNQHTGGRSGAVRAANFYKWAGRSTVAATVIIGGIETYNGYQIDGGHFGYNANSAAAKTIGGVGGGLAGAALGAKIGAGFGALFWGIGSVPGAVIGGFIGGWVGGEMGTRAAQGSVNLYYGDNLNSNK